MTQRPSMQADTLAGAVPMRPAATLRDLPVLTLLLVAANVGLFLWQIASGVSATEPTAGDLIHWGANVSAFTLTGDTWRLPASMFLHIGVTHLLVNMLSLVFLGVLAERSFGKADFAIIYVLSGLGGGVVSAVWNSSGHAGMDGLADYLPAALRAQHVIISAGASGALMGVAAASVMLRLVCVVREQPWLHAYSGKAIAAIIFMNLAYGWQTSGTDNACHAGGILAGAVAGSLLAWCRTSRPLPRTLMRVLLLAAGVLAAVTALRGYAADEELQDSRAQLNEQLRRETAEQAQRRDKAHADAQALIDAASLPAPVDERAASGTRIALAEGVMHFTVGADGLHAYVTNNSANTLLVVDLAAKKIVRTIAGGNFSTGLDGCPDNMCAGRGAAGVAVSADGKRAYVTSMREDAVALVDLVSGKVTGAIAAGRFPTDIVLSPDQKYAYVLNAVGNSISVLDLAAGKAVGAAIALSEQDASQQAFGHPTALALTPDGKILYVTNSGAGSISAIDTASRRKIGETPIEDGPYDLALSPDGRTLSVLSAHSMQQLDAASLATRKSLAACQDTGSYAFAVSTDGRRAALAESDSSQIRIVKLDTGRTLGLYPTGTYPRQVAFVPNSTTMLALSENALSVLDENRRMALPADADSDASGQERFCSPDPDQASPPWQ